jgi:amylovoran biosynthesis glycosyltransferase AmsE
MSLYHAEKPSYLDACFCSLLWQSYQAAQIVLVLDGSIPSDLMDVVNKWRVEFDDFCIVALDVNQGLGSALNIGLQSCKYNLVARVDTDDINLSSRFEEQIGVFYQNPELTICGSQIDEVEPDTIVNISTRRVPEFSHEIQATLISKNPFNHMTVMFKKDAVMEVGGYLHLQSMEDWFLWIRIFSANYKGYNIQKSLVLARTGVHMLRRRSGLNYIKCEYNIARVKLKYLPSANKIAIFNWFLLRSIVRVFPEMILNFIYKCSRRFL